MTHKLSQREVAEACAAFVCKKLKLEGLIAYTTCLIYDAAERSITARVEYSPKTEEKSS